MSGAEVILGVVAGGAGLASLAIQLQENVEKLKTFYQSVKHADARLKDLIFELESTTLQLKEIEKDLHLATSSDELLDRCIAQCQRYAGELQQTADQIASYMRRSSKTGRIFWALKEHEVDKLWTKIERANGQLQLAMQRLAVRQICNMRHDMPKLLAQAKEFESFDNNDGDSVTATHRRATFKSSRRKPRWQIRFTAWFSATVFDVAFHYAQGSWTVLLRMETLRPFSAKAYRFCKHGDIGGIQRMIDTRQASFTDVFNITSKQWWRPSGTLLAIAAQHGQFALCEWLLSQALWPQHLYQLDSGDWVGRHCVDAYRLFIEAVDSDVDIETIKNMVCWWRSGADEECLEIVLRNQSVPLHTIPIEDRFEIASEIIGPSTPAAWLAAAGILDSDGRLPTIKTVSGWTMLHNVALQIYKCDDLGQTTSKWVQLGVQLLKAGADANAVATFPRNSVKLPSTPLICLFLWSGNIRSYMDLVEIWSAMLQSADIDLEAFWVKERELLRTFEMTDVYYRLGVGKDNGCVWDFGPRTSLEGVTYNNELRRWRLEFRDHEAVQWYALRLPVGSYPRDPRIPATIAWEPRRHEIEEGPWEPTSTSLLHGEPYDVETRLSGHENWKKDRELFIKAAQDDASFAVLAERRTSYRHSHQSALRKRSASAPNTRDIRNEWIWGNRLMWLPPKLGLGHWNETSQTTSIFEERDWYLYSFLADIQDCQEDVDYFNERKLDEAKPAHTGRPGCPWGCDKVHLDKLAVPESCREQHPKVREGFEP